MGVANDFRGWLRVVFAIRRTSILGTVFGVVGWRGKGRRILKR